MAKTIEQIQEEVQQIKNETVAKQNTATRVGGALEDIVDHVEHYISDVVDRGVAEAVAAVEAKAQSIDKLTGDVATLGSKVGELSELETADKTNVVSAINEALTKGGIPDAPSDGTLYLRKDGKWFGGVSNEYTGDYDFEITKIGDHPSNLDRIKVNIPAGDCEISLRNVTTSNNGTFSMYAHYVDDEKNTMLCTAYIGDGFKAFTALKPIDSLGFYMSNQTNVSTGMMRCIIKSSSNIFATMSLDTDKKIESALRNYDNDISSIKAKIGDWSETQSGYGSDSTWKMFKFSNLNPLYTYTIRCKGIITDATIEGQTAFVQILTTIGGVKKQLKTVFRGGTFPQDYEISFSGATAVEFTARYHEDEFMEVNVSAACNISEVLDNKYNIYDIKRRLDIIDLSSDNRANIAVGTIYNGNLSTDSVCLFDSNFYSVIEYVDVRHQEDLLVRVTEYDADRVFIRQTGYVAFNERYYLDARTRFIRLSCNYTNRGYSASNKITTDAYTKGDFYCVINISTQIEKLDNIDDDIVAQVFCKEQKINNSINLLDYGCCIKGQLFINGTISNSDVWVTDFIYCKGESKISYNYGGRSGLGVCFYDKDKNYIVGYSQYQTTSQEIPEKAYFVRLNVSYYNTTGMIVFGDESGLTPFVPFKGVKYIFDSLDELRNDIPDTSNIISANSDKDVAISALRNAPNKYATQNRGLYPIYGVVTDIHSDWVRLNRALEYSINIGATALLVLGDIGDQQAAFDAFDWQSFVLNSSIPILAIPGNHEFVYNSGQTNYVGYTDETLKAKLYNDALVAHNGEIHPNGKNYWYKDITSIVRGTEYKLRIIGLYQHEFVDTWTDGHPDHTQNSGKAKDDVYYKQEQIDWLVNLLDTADDNTHVVIMAHWALCPENVRVDNPYNPNEKFGINISSGCTHASNNRFIPEIIDAWIKGTSVISDSTMRTDSSTISVNHTFSKSHHGQFVGYLCGHTHYDAITRVKDMDEQYNYVFTCTSVSDGQQSGDLTRSSTGKAQDSFAIFGYDFLKSKVGIVKIGSDVTIDMRDKKYTCNFNI